jgi:hypothetical protein
VCIPPPYDGVKWSGAVTLQFSIHLPKYAQITPLSWEVVNGLPGHDLLFSRLKQVPDENELMFEGSNSGRLMAYFGNQGCF